MVKNFWRYVCFNRIHECDGRTDTAWWYMPRLCIEKIVRFWWNLV